MADKFQILKVDPQLTLTIDNDRRPRPTAALLRRIEDNWNRRRQSNAKLFDGEVFVWRSMSKNNIDGCLVPYSWCLAALDDAVVRHELCLVPMGISAITATAGQRVLLGRRSAHVSLYPSLYEFAPSGVVDGRFRHSSGTIDVHSALLDELFEETHIPPEEVLRNELFAVVYDPSHGTVELCYALFISDRGFSTATAPTDEYPEILSLPADAIDDFLRQRPEEMVPLSAALWRHWQHRYVSPLEPWLP